MITTDAKCHMKIKRKIVIGEEILKQERTSERKTRKESEETDDKNQCYGVSCCMDHRHGLREKKI